MNHPDALTFFIFLWTAFALFLFPVLFFVKQPYGRHFSERWGPAVPNQTGWIIMELPSLIIFSYFYTVSQNFSLSTTILFALWFVHYFNRSLIFPFRIKTKGKKMPLLIMLFGIIFNVVNASLNGLFLSKIPDFHSFSLSDFIRFAIGLILFISGLIINLTSDNILMRLRKKSENGYYIPNGGMFKWVSCPNYLGEILEWTGFALMAWNPAAVSFAVWTFVNLVPRAIDHHKWYRQHFADYPVNRKAIIPYLL